MEEHTQSEDFNLSSYFAKSDNTLGLLRQLNRFPDYSIENRFLIHKQRPSAIAVTNLSKLKELGYAVKDNEPPIKIMVPTKSDKQTTGFVYDISQTNLPIDQIYRLYPNRYFDFNIQLNDDRSQLNHKLEKFADSKNVSLNSDDFFNPFNPYEATSCLIDEVSALQSHDLGKNINSRKLEELQGKMTSYLVHDSFAMNISDEVSEYIDNWTNEKGEKINDLSNQEQLSLLKNVTLSTDCIINKLNGSNLGLEERRATDFSFFGNESMAQELDNGLER